MNNADLLIKILKLNENIKKQYQKLILLEIDGKENTSEFYKIKNNIRMCKPFIYSYYDEISKDPVEFNQIVNLILDTGKIEDETIFSNVISFKPLNKTERTLIDTYYVSFKNSTYIDVAAYQKKVSELTIDELYDVTAQKNLQELENTYHDFVKDRIEELKDTLIAYNLYEEILHIIEQVKNPKLKARMIRMKYNLIYSFMPLEEDFLNDDLSNWKKYDEINNEILSLFSESDFVDIDDLLDEQIALSLEDITQYTDEDYNHILTNITIQLKLKIAKTLISIQDKEDRCEDNKKRGINLCEELKKEKKYKTRKILQTTFGYTKKNRNSVDL